MQVDGFELFYFPLNNTSKCCSYPGCENVFFSSTVYMGSWFDHVKEYCEAQNHLNIHFVQYEDLLKVRNLLAIAFKATTTWLINIFMALRKK